MKAKGKHVPYELTYLEGTLMDDYIYDTQILQKYAELNRRVMLDEYARWHFTGDGAWKC